MDGYSNPKNHSATHEKRSTAANPSLSFLDDFLHDVKSKWSSSKLSGTSKKQTANDSNFKLKVMEAWNNFKFEIWDTLSMKQDSPLWLLGNCYHIQNVDGHVPMKIKDVENIHEILAKQSTNQLEMFFCDLYSIPWFTYRKGFSPINGKLGGLYRI
ncbi:unnamed protein product [Clavelina lepadiformis]|uniref:Uncharacterized protein n=1 Tax=Clavelina lepadiformis TaxID=159417 RepID=A0ABP0G0X3_CLALP